MKNLVLALSALSLIAGAATQSIAASPCRDKHGKFVKCPEKPAAHKSAPCRDKHGKYMKC